MITVVLRKRGGLKTFARCAGALLLLLAVWCLLSGLHYLMLYMTRTQWPMAYWQSTAANDPSPKTGIAMAIAAKPIPLLAYFLLLWPILPGSVEATRALVRRWPRWERRVCYALLALGGLAAVVFHLYMVFVGYFFE